MMNAADIARRAGHDNRMAVWNFFRDNPCHSRAECAAALGLHRKTVEGHATAIRAGWRPRPHHAKMDEIRNAIAERSPA